MTVDEALGRAIEALGRDQEAIAVLTTLRTALAVVDDDFDPDWLRYLP